MNNNLTTVPNLTDAKNIPANQRANAVVEIEQSRAVAEMQGAMVIAKKFPRNQIEAIERIKNACCRPTLASGALYSYARGGSEITGPSIRLAEVIAQNWGNIQFGIRELERNAGRSQVEAFAWDMETNVREVKTFTVEHTRYTKSGSRKLEDPRDIYELIANDGARRLRSCILSIIPGDVVEAAVAQCEATLKASADTSLEAVKKLVETFATFGVSAEQIEKRIQCRLDAIKPAQIVNLRKIYQSLRDGMSEPATWFEMPKIESEKNGIEGVKEKLNKKLEQDAASTNQTDLEDSGITE